MRRRPTRPNVFRSLKRFGVFPTDWKYILVPVALVYFLPFVFGIWIYNVPAGFPLGVAAFAVLLGSFSFLRKSKPECWMRHRLSAALDRWAPVRPPAAGEFEAAEWTHPE
jgi:hypothetical protein